MKEINLKDAFWIACFCSCVLFITGLVSVPFAAKHDVLTQNFIYLWGRIPVIFFCFAVYFNLGKKR